MRHLPEAPVLSKRVPIVTTPFTKKQKSWKRRLSVKGDYRKKTLSWKHFVPKSPGIQSFLQVFTIVGQLRRPFIGKRGGLFSYFCRHNFIIRRKLWWVLEKPNFYQVMIFIALTIHFWAENLLFIHYSLFIYCSLDSNNHPSDLKWRKKC